MDHQALDIQEYAAPKGILGLLDPKGYQGYQALQVLVSQALKGCLDTKEIQETLATLDNLVDQAHQVKLSHAVMKKGKGHLDARGNQVYQDPLVYQEEMASLELRDTQDQKD